MSDSEDWCQSSEEEPDETHEEDLIIVQADYVPDRWNS